jgi:hypothetical protein
MVTNPNALKPSLENLWNVNNFNVWLQILQGTTTNYWIGLWQNINLASCPNAGALPNVFEPSFNWTWLDGTPLLRDSQGQGIAFFGGGEPYNAGVAESTMEHPIQQSRI